MSSFENGDDLQIMAGYDFKTPIDTAIIFYDSDDEENPPIEIQYNPESEDTNHGNCGNNVISKSSDNINQDIHNKSTKRQCTDEVITIKKRKTNESVPVSNNIHVAEIIIRYPSSLTTPIDLVDTDSSNQAPVELNNNLSKTSVELQGPPNFQHSTNNTKPGHQVNNEVNVDSLSRYTENTRPIIHNPYNSTNSNCLSSQVFLPADASQCMESLLLTVSDHIISIMKARTFFYDALNTHDKAFMQCANNQYRQTKHHFFNLSFTTVANLILPKENNKYFMQAIFDNTYRLGQTRNVLFTYQDMVSIFNQLFDWVKTHRYPLLSKLLDVNPQPQDKLGPDKTKELEGGSRRTPNDGNVNKTWCLHQYPVKESVAKTVPAPPMYRLQRDKTRYNVRPNRRRDQEGSSYDTANAENNSRIMTQNQQQNRESVINIGSAQIGAIQPSKNVYKNLENTLQPYVTFPNHQDSHIGKSSVAPFSSFVGKFPAFDKNNVSAENPKNILTKKKEEQKQIYNPPPPYPMKYATYQHEQHNYSQDTLNSTNYSSFQVDNQTIEGTRSLSRDSGIMSPVSSVPSSPMMTPLITHVTSLNPNATLFRDGICFVCRTPTKQMCLGCYKIYYCSHSCQLADLKNHAAFCKYQRM